MMYRLNKNSKGMITNQARDGEAGNIYANREAINKKALENLEKNTPSGRLGKLGDLQVFNFSIINFASGTTTTIFEEYNTDLTISPNDCVMFSNGKSGDGLYYNVVDINVTLNVSSSNFELDPCSYVQFYLLQNGQTPTGEYIPKQQKMFSSVSASPMSIITTNAQALQYVHTDIITDSVNIPSNSLGLRCSGLALKRILINFRSNEVLSNAELEFMVYVDNSSVSRSF